MINPKSMLHALKLSIQHWIENEADPLKAKIGGQYCACCRYDNLKLKEEAETRDVDYTEESCSFCLVRQYTGRQGCDDTPYGWATYRYDEARAKGFRLADDELAELSSAIQEEREFLEHVLAWEQASNKGD